MWISREQYVANLTRAAHLETEVKSKIEQISRLEKEIAYWREKFESAQNRADRIADKSLTVSGIGPVSDLGMKELDDVMGRYAKMAKETEQQATEMFGEEIKGEGEENFELQVEPELLSALVEGMKE